MQDSRKTKKLVTEFISIASVPHFSHTLQEFPRSIPLFATAVQQQHFFSRKEAGHGLISLRTLASNPHLHRIA